MGLAHIAVLVLSFVGATGSTTISFILPGLFYWKASFFMEYYWMRRLTERVQLTRNDGSVSKGMNLAALGLMVYGVCVFVFWQVFDRCRRGARTDVFSSLGFNIYSVAKGGAGST